MSQLTIYRERLVCANQVLGCAAFNLFIVLGIGLAALPPARGAAEPAVEVVLSGLNNPWGLAVQPETHDLLLAESGAGRLIRCTLGTSPPKTHSLIEGFKVGPWGPDAGVAIGPTGVALIDKDTLIVGETGGKDAPGSVRVYNLPADGRTLGYDEVKVQAPLAATDKTKAGKVLAVVVTGQSIFASAADDGAGRIVKLELRDMQAPHVDDLVSATPGFDFLHPLGLAISRRGDVVAAKLGKFGNEHDSFLAFYGPHTGKLELHLATDLQDMVGVAYSPRTNRLYAIDFAGGESNAGGLYRLDSALDGHKPAVKAVKIVSLDRPTSLSFAPDGPLYISTLGTPKTGSTEPAGQLLKILGL